MQKLNTGVRAPVVEKNPTGFTRGLVSEEKVQVKTDLKADPPGGAVAAGQPVPVMYKRIGSGRILREYKVEEVPPDVPTTSRPVIGGGKC